LHGSGREGTFASTKTMAHSRRRSLTKCLFYSTVGMAAVIAVSVLPSITVRLPPARLATKARWVALSTAIAYGPPLAFTVAITELFAPSITVTVPPRLFAT
jgi:hypothetical protein